MELSREKTALLRCVQAIVARRGQDIGDLDRINWSEVYAEACWHQVSGLVYEALKSRSREGLLPGEVRKKFAYAYHFAGIRNEVYRRCVTELLREARRENVDVMLLKGIVLADTAYRRPEHRFMTDVDLLVREQEFPVFRRFLQKLGYKTSVPDLSAEELPRYAHYFQQVRFGCRKPLLETHFRLFNLGVPIVVEPAWDDSSVIRFGETEARCPSPERFLLHLCLHAQQHGFSRLRYFVDIAVLTRSRNIDWELFIDLAKRHHLRSVAHQALTYSSEILEVPGFEPTLAGLRPGPLKRRVIQFLWRDKNILYQRASCDPMDTELPKAFLLGDAPIAEKFVFFWNVLMPPGEWLSSCNEGRETRWKRIVRVLLTACKGFASIFGRAMPCEHISPKGQGSRH